MEEVLYIETDDELVLAGVSLMRIETSRGAKLVDAYKLLAVRVLIRLLLRTDLSHCIDLTTTPDSLGPFLKDAHIISPA